MRNSLFVRLLQRGLIVAPLVLLGACSSKPKEVEPTALTSFEREYRVDREWHRYSGLGSLRKPLRLEPALSEQYLYLGDMSGRVRALQRSSGRTVWLQNTELRISTGVRGGYGRLLLGTRDGEAVALSADDGSELWRTQLSGELLSRPATDGEVAIFQSQDGRVVALNAADGAVLWSFEVTVPVLTLRGLAEPLLVGNRVFAGTASGRVVALELVSGSPVWERRVAEPSGRSELDRLVDIDGNLVLENGGLFVSTFQGKLAVLDEDSGRVYWDFNISSANIMSSLGGVLFVADNQGVVRAIDQRTGNELWKQEGLIARKLTGTAIHNDLVVVGDRDGYLHWLDPQTGKFVARQRHDPDGFAATPMVYGDVLYAVSADGEVAAYRLKATR
ncbi:outer membrane protein assembly factor BamB [Alcanivorax sp. 1008]|uniref:outer membrane protein assembly factor BamB n=1 Tax=Alcanivorax sp. 1008 TaxID=2816853 RepID=UPI001E16D585|nr:outer membrane protein assembly factor BamB [Alcanivorax sp. 1008]MCC1497298.1 outer membrane protein assembly factor BamB [Alcanivorax sp. 1008]